MSNFCLKFCKNKYTQSECKNLSVV